MKRVIATFHFLEIDVEILEETEGGWYHLQLNFWKKWEKALAI